MTLAVSPFSNYDPISVPKMAVLATVAFAILGICISSSFSEIVYESKTFSGLTFCFVLALLIPIFFSGSNLGQQFWGVFGRNTGFLTYFSLAIVMWAASNATTNVFGKKLSKSLLITAAVTTIYCLIQIAGYDPIQWSLMDTFATLGNINFLSAFLGLSSITSFAILLSHEFPVVWRITSLILLTSGLPIIWSTGSIQGLMMFILGFYIVTFFVIKSKFKSRLLYVLYLLVGVIGSILGLQGLRNKGPLASFLYQPSVTFREDYMHAGWEMMILKPFVGVGLDSYGDWYRQVRGQISTMRTDPERVSNSAHNIFLDLASGGGALVFLLYLSLYVYCFAKCLAHIRKTPTYDPVFVALFASWCAYILQAVISINQIGVGVWGALLLGALLSYTRLNKGDLSVNEKKLIRSRSHAKEMVLPAKVALVSYFFASIGFFASFPPLKIDADFRKASTPEQSMMVAKSRLASSFYKEMTLQRLLEQSRYQESKKMAQEIVAGHPRSFYAWKMLTLIPGSTSAEVEEARKELKKLDPFNPNVG